MQNDSADWAKTSGKPEILIVDDNVEIIKTLAALLSDAAEIRSAVVGRRNAALKWL
jgi:CheY-like chemotaxis protein